MPNTINPATGKTNEQVLAETTASTKKVAESLGGTFEQGKMVDGQVTGGYKPAIISSNSVLDDKKKGNAVNQAAGALVTTPTDPTSTASQYTQFLKDSQKQNNDMTAQAQQAIKLSFNSALAANNAKYKQMHDELTSSYNDSIQVANNNAAALNPYSTAKGAETAANFTGKITQQYNQQALKIQQQADQAQAELEAGNYQSYVDLMKESAKSNQDFTNSMYQFVINQQNQAEQTHEFELNYGLNKETKAQDDFQKYVDTLSGSDGIQTDISNYFKTGQISEGLMPIIDKGMAAGMNPDEALSLMQYQTDKVRNQAALEEYRFNQQILAQNRIANAQDRQTSAQLFLANSQALASKSADLIGRGIQPGTPEYAVEMAKASQYSTKALSGTDALKFSAMGNVVTQLQDLKPAIDAISNNSPLWNTLQKYVGTTASQFLDPDAALLNKTLEASAGTFAKTFGGESGTLATQDVARALNGLPTSAGTTEIRNALYNALLDKATQHSASELDAYTNAGYYTASYAPTVEALGKKAQSLKYGTGTPGVTKSGIKYSIIP